VSPESSVVYETVEDGWVMARVPELPGAVTQGKDLAEARTMIREAVELLLQAYREGANHSIHRNPANGRCAAVPRHIEVRDTVARTNSEQLGIPRP
jgi:predicted RNase H-like HicB family nuclease